jgi:cysteine synthase A
MVDRMERVSDDEAIEMARRVSKEEGVLCGISCGAAVTAAVRLAKEKEMKDKLIVVILPDSGERYLSSALYDGIGD